MRILAIVLILFVGCAKHHATPGKESSIWTQNNTTTAIDLSHGEGIAPGTILINGAVSCTCVFALKVSFYSGSLEISACSNPGTCSAYEGAFTYTYIPNETLEICRTSDHSCLEYH